MTFGCPDCPEAVKERNIEARISAHRKKDFLIIVFIIQHSPGGSCTINREAKATSPIVTVVFITFQLMEQAQLNGNTFGEFLYFHC